MEKLMKKQDIILSDIDKMILNSYKNVLQGLADYLGEGYELVLHSLGNLEKSVICIINGHHTGRKEGAPITDLALNMLNEKINSQNNFITYFSKNKKGEPLKSSTIAIRGQHDRIIGLLCINFYMNTTIDEMIHSFIPDKSDILLQTLKENFTENTDEIIITTLESVQQQVYSDQSISTSNRNKAIVYALDNLGVFNFKDSVIKVSKLMNISKNTVYMHLRNKNNGG